MDASGESKREDETLLRRLNIVYFLNRKGKIEQPHLIKVHHPDNNGVYLRDFKRCLSKLMGKEMPESFSWSCKRIYKNGNIWQDLAEDDLLIPISNRDRKYILMGSLVFSPIKIIKKLKEEKEEPKLLATSTTLKSSFKTNTSPKSVTKVDKESPMKTSASTSASSYENGASLNSEKAKKKTVTIKIDYSREDMKRIKMQENEEIVPKENMRKFNGVKIKESDSDGAHKWASILRNFMRCRMMEKDSIIKAMSNQSGGSSRSNNINEEKSGDKRNQTRKEGGRKRFFFCNR